jgi:hypothetical protein
MDTIRKDGHQWEAEFRFTEGGSRMPSIIEVIHGAKGSNPLNETINETIEIEPITLVFGVLSGIIVGSLLWYFGLT